MFANHLRERPVNLHERVESLKIPVDVRLRLLRQALRQRLREGLFRHLGQLIPKAFACA